MKINLILKVISTAALACISIYAMYCLTQKDISIFVGQVLVDDAFYYLKPAQNLIAGKGLSFDGVNLTNGYHPLWMVVTVLICFFGDIMFQAKMLSLMGGLLYLSGALIISYVGLRNFKYWQKTLIFILFAFNLMQAKIFLQGLESGLNFFLLTVVVALFVNPKMGDLTQARNKIIFGTFLALLALSRVDQILLVIFLIVFLAADSASFNFLKKMSYSQKQGAIDLYNFSLLIVAPVIILFGAYLIFNYWEFQTITPVSGMVKKLYETEWLSAGYPNGGFYKNILFHFKYIYGISIGQIWNSVQFSAFSYFNLSLINIGFIWFLTKISILPLLVGIFNVIKFRNNSRLSKILFAYFFFSIFHVILYATQLPHFTIYGTWYFSLEILMITILYSMGLMYIFDRIYSFSKGKIPTTIGVILLLPFVLLLSSVTIYESALYGAKDPRVNRFLLASEWINSNLPKNIMIGAHSSGTLGYFVEDRSVINLDGLINSYQYYNVLRNGKFKEYVIDNIDYYSDYSILDLEKEGLCWSGGCVPPNKLTLVKKWHIEGDQNYFILKISK